MTRTVSLAAAAFATAVLATAAACPSSTPAASEELVLKAYDVPAEHAAELQGIIQNLLWTGKDTPRKGTAALAPSGQLLVAAPAAFQPGIADAVARLKSGPSVQAPTVTLDYWVVVGTKADAATPGASVSNEIAGVVDSLQKSQGNMKLALLERVRVAAQSGSRAQIEGALMRVSQTAALHGDKVVADVDITRSRHTDGGLQARVEVPLGQIAVLGQAGASILDPHDADLAQAQAFAPASFVDEAAKGHSVTAFYIVRASVDGK